MKKILTVLAVVTLFFVVACTQQKKETVKAEAPVVEEKKSTLDIVRERGKISCGVNTGLAGFSSPDSNGNWTGIDVDVCRAVSSAVFGVDTNVEYVGLSAQQRFTALQSGEVDLLTRNTTWTLQRDSALGLNFAPTNYYDGQGFMVRKKGGITSASQLDGATVCVQPGTTTELNLADYFKKTGMKYNPVVIENKDELTTTYFNERCDVYTTDVSGLAAERSKAQNPDDHLILSEVISKEPLGPSVRHGDDQWFDIVKWSVIAMINAEELGLTSANIDSFVETENPSIKRIIDSELGANLGLDSKWAYNIIKNVGNYGESFERNIGESTPVGLPRGLNNLWINGGILYGPPIR